MTHGFGGFRLLLGGGGSQVKMLAVWQVVALGPDSSFFSLQMMIKFKILNTIKTNVPRVSVLCIWHLCTA